MPRILVGLFGAVCVYVVTGMLVVITYGFWEHYKPQPEWQYDALGREYRKEYRLNYRDSHKLGLEGKARVLYAKEMARMKTAYRNPEYRGEPTGTEPYFKDKVTTY